MIRRSRRLLLCLAVLHAAAVLAAAQPKPAAIAFTVSAPDPATHTYHVVMRCQGLPAGDAEFRMPVWTPGYYGLFDFAGNVRNFAASDATGQALTWQKSGPQAWTVRTTGSARVELSYDVVASNPFVASLYLDENRGYITPGGLFLYVPGRLRQSVTVTIDLPARWSTVATGLAPVSPKTPHTYLAPDFDVLYDSPILMGNLEALPTFTVRGVPHQFVGYNLGEFDRARFIEGLRAVVEAGVRIIGEIPYTHYTFLAIGPGQGGIEHLNSTAFGFSGTGLRDRAGTNRTLSFLAHEYFHLYNVKRIRPIALGPFDYDKANVTNMLWVSEGFTSYYQNVIMARAGLSTPEELLAGFGRTIATVENNTGHLFQSATESSRTTWTQGPFGGRGGTGLRKTISYYDKGSVLGLLLDLKIRHEAGNHQSLDSVMRTLYQTYYKQQHRGWTDEEFRAVCERTAGTTLEEIFEYASTTKEIDYAKYLGYAGLELEPAVEQPAAHLGALAEDVEGRLTVAAVESASPAAAAGLQAGDVIASLDGAVVDAKGLDAAIAAKTPGAQVALRIVRGQGERALTAALDHKVTRSYALRPMANASALQVAILNSLSAPDGGAAATSAPRGRGGRIAGQRAAAADSARCPR